MPQPVHFEVDRRDHAVTRVHVPTRSPALKPGQVRFAIDRFALTANNITYALVGDLLDYWGFFPAKAPWGRIPAMGWADLVESAHPEVAVGGRYFGWYPMASELVVDAKPSSTGLVDASAHRTRHAPIYRAFQDSSRDPLYDAENEDRHALLRGLFITAFLADDFLFDRDFFGSDATIVLSASSKTAIGLAVQSHARGRRTIGMTSPGNVAFVEGLGVYDQVVSYATLSEIDPATDAVVVDMAGNSDVLRRVHEHLDSRLRYSMGIGMSHGDAGRLATDAEALPGPQPELFFAPSQIEKRMGDWGPEVYGQRIAEALRRFIDHSSAWLDVETSTGGEALTTVYQDLLAGRLAPHRGQVLSLR